MMIYNSCGDDHPLSLFLSVLGSPVSKRQYPKRLQNFSNFLNVEGDVKELAPLFVNHYKHQDNVDWNLEGRLLAFAKNQ
jgi:hypothetical protein